MKTVIYSFLLLAALSWGSGATTIVDYPYFAAIEVDGQHRCSAAIIDDLYVMTSKTCVQDINVTTSAVYVRVGTNKISFRGQDLRVTKIYLDDSSFLLSTSSDLAMVKVATPFEYSNKVAWTNPNNDGLSEGLEGVVLGWSNLHRAVSDLIAAPAVVMSSDSCSAAYQGIMNISSTQACISPSSSNSRPCIADLGAPFYLNEQLYGVVSYNPGCDSDLPMVLTAVGGSGVFIIEVLCDILSMLNFDAFK